MSNVPLELRKQLFRSPSVEGERVSDGNSALMFKLQIEHDLELSYQGLQKDLHEQRMKNLRQKAKSLAENDWQYPAIENLIGLN
ncbi:anaphase-promoting complex subunit 16-like [Octopus vulgaris]|uniref:Anaphase-promoting complex subunit 16-like n=3 Tax=Octopus TaxID=6643 RepID=A0AA36F584_OCTVU|nr:uncharacterized protein LOC106868624 [Octopus bimaculoides]XP_029638785.1 uncharacterized protein LOC115213929 [Octopus sinensis]CAI9726231.1 anaphase-promoting complex subunit 16-like [Octopus vulgaris]|eukprot:XP_014769460.1 PREDICTED: uncharacterized protein LOC106868624 [Octopus bimaculoides]